MTNTWLFITNPFIMILSKMGTHGKYAMALPHGVYIATGYSWQNFAARRLNLADYHATRYRSCF